MTKFFNQITLIEAVLLAAVFAVCGVLALGIVTGHIDPNDPTTLCKLRGGVPIHNEDGRLMRCDFPVNISR